MLLSWLPLISDYIRVAEKPVAATTVSSVVYCIVSCWMYIIGMGAAIYAGEYDIAQIILKAGCIMGLLIIVFPQLQPPSWTLGQQVFLAKLSQQS